MYRLLLLIGLIAVVLYVVSVTGVAEQLSVSVVKDQIAAYGPAAPVAFMVLYAIVTVAFLPGTPFTLLGGVLFGPWWGTLYVVIGASCGAMAAFLLARLVGGAVTDRLSGAIGTRLQSYDARLRANGFLTVLVLRLVPLFPFNGLNFGLGVTKVRFTDYALGTVLGIIPGTFAYVYFGNALGTFAVAEIVIGIALILLFVLGARLLHKKFPIT